MESSVAKATDKDIWVKDLELTKEHLRIIKSGEDLDDFTVYSAMSLLQKQFPLLMVQSPAIYRVSGYDYSPCQTVQIVHNDAHHWLLLSTLKGTVTIYDSMNTTPTESLIRQMTQLFSPDDSIPTFERRKCHRQMGVNDCGVFAIAYAVALMNGNEPDGMVFDQSKMRKHLIGCFEKQDMQPFPVYRRGVTSKPTIERDHSTLSWTQPRRSARLSQKNSSTTKVDVQNRFTGLEITGESSIDSKETNEYPQEKNSEDIEHTASQRQCSEEKEHATPHEKSSEKKEHKISLQPSCQASGNNLSSVVNLSQTKLTEAEKKVLERGLNFCIVEKKINRENLLEDTYKFSRKMKLRAHFDKDNPTEAEESSTKEETKDITVDDERSEMRLLKNPYYNPSNSPPENLAVYINAVKNSIINLWNRKTPITNNLSEEERLALDALQKREDIIIKQADKGGKTVIMDRKDYIKELEYVFTLLEQKVAGTKSREVAQCFEKQLEHKVAGT